MKSKMKSSSFPCFTLPPPVQEGGEGGGRVEGEGEGVLLIFSAMQKDTGTKFGSSSYNFIRNIFICTVVCQLAGCFYGNKVLFFSPNEFLQDSI